MTDEKRTPPLVEIAVVLRLTPDAHAALVAEADAWKLAIDDTASSIIEVQLTDRDPVAEFRAALEQAGTSGEEFARAWRRGRGDRRRDSVPPEGGRGDA